MIWALISLVIAFCIAFGRHLAVIGRMRHALWFFRHFELKRWIFSVISLVFGLIGLIQYPIDQGVIWVFVGALFLLSFAFLFDMKRFFPEINQITRVAAADIKIDATTAILGVEKDGVAIAYPMAVLAPRHIINDEINGHGILASFCAICQSAFAFDAYVQGVNHTFKVAGVWRRNMIVHDVATYSLWQQATGECIYGPLKGAQMRMLSGENTVLSSWVKKHPESEYASELVEARWGYFSREFLFKALKFLMPKAHMPGFADLSEMDAHTMVFGVEFNGVARAYPALQMDGSISFEADFDGKKIMLTYDDVGDYLTAIEPNSGAQIVVEKHWWLGWKEFHQNSEIWPGFKPGKKLVR